MKKCQDEVMMNILLTNDDGIFSEGLIALHKKIADKNQVVIIAPERERSAVSHSITLHRPLRVIKVAINGSTPSWAVSGTPADCIKLGLLEILETRPDVVISGINSGANVGININYSGTVSAAREAAVYGIPAIAVSMDSFENTYYEDAAEFVTTLMKKMPEFHLPRGTFLNVNYPNCHRKNILGVKFSRQSIAQYPEYVEKRIDPRNKTYYWQGCDASHVQDDKPDLDSTVLGKRFISITPIKCDNTDYEVMEKLTGRNIDF